MDQYFKMIGERCLASLKKEAIGGFVDGDQVASGLMDGGELYEFFTAVMQHSINKRVAGVDPRRMIAFNFLIFGIQAGAIAAKELAEEQRLREMAGEMVGGEVAE